MLAAASRGMSPARGFSRAVIAALSGAAPMRTMSTAAMTTFTAGPASATTSSSRGLSGMRSSEATPPIGHSVTSGVRMP
jgi:hypothetical protein